MNHFLDILGSLMLGAITLIVFGLPFVWWLWLRKVLHDGYKDDPK